LEIAVNINAEVLQAVDDLELVLGQSAQLTDNLDDHRKHGLELRRQILAKVAMIGSLGEQAFDAGGRELAFRGEFSKMRSAMAYHQASWPIVSIKPDDPDYLLSVRALREANRHFIGWVRAALPAG
jgi:hypothetical protein